MKPSKIFIVEDKVMTIKVIETYLTSWGYEIAGSARTLDEALKKVAQLPPDLALLDINLGTGMERDGIELAHRFRQQYAFPIVFLTGEPEIQVMKQAQTAQPDAYLTKPMSEASLAFAIDDALQKAAERQSKPYEAINPDVTPLKENGSYALLEDTLFVKQDHSYKKLPVTDILWIQADRQYSKIKTLKETYLVSTNLGNFSHQFEHPSLLRVSRSHIINIQHINEFEENHMIIVHKTAIHIGKTYRETVQKRFRFLKTTR